MRTLLKRLARTRDERGFTILLAVYVLTITSLLLGAAYIAVLNDTGLSRNDLDQKRAYAAAQAGIAQYSYDLNQNPNYWESCPSTAQTSTAVPVGSADSGSTEYYSYKTLPASGQSSCVSGTFSTVIEATGSNSAGTFRVSATGYSNNVSRTIVAQYNHASFLNFVYYTNFEQEDPSALYATGPYTDITDAQVNSGIGASGRGATCTSGPGPYLPGCTTTPTDCYGLYFNTATYPTYGRPNDCGQIEFKTTSPVDAVKGPFYTNDTIKVCWNGGDRDVYGGPIFGRTSNDAIDAPGFSAENPSSTGCAAPPTTPADYTLAGTLHTNLVGTIQMPSQDTQLLNVAQAGGCVYTGPTTIVLSGTTMNVTNASSSGNTCLTGNGVSWPTNGVIFVQNVPSTTCPPYYPNLAAYPGSANCGDVYVSGNYGNSLTIASGNDIVINGNIYETGYAPPAQPGGTALLGLIADDFVRVENGPVTTRGTAPVCQNTTTGTSTPSLYVAAGILAVTHSFMVDNYGCSTALGTSTNLTVWGAIAQQYRGVVSQYSGYVKNYNYDDRFASAEPPYFLNPVSAAWYVQRQTECATSTACGN
jgi:Tfp pilus assembly protein PilX